MRSSTFNFNANFIKVILLAMFGFGVYSLVLQGISPKITTYQNLWVANYAVAEKYIYIKEAPRTVVVGSSMSDKLLEEKLGRDVYNLSFSAGSALTGLNIIKKSNIVPENIFVETNFIERKINRDMINGLFTPVIWKIRGKILSLQYTYQPINVVLTLIRSYFGTSNADKMNRQPNKKRLQHKLKEHHQLNSQIKVFDDSSELDELKGLVNYFEDLGVRIFFFQMPAHNTILSSKRYLVRKSILLQMFPQGQFNWVKHENANKYQTSDGIHLLYKSASKFSTELNKMINKSLNSTRAGGFSLKPGQSMGQGAGVRV